MLENATFSENGDMVEEFNLLKNELILLEDRIQQLLHDYEGDAGHNDILHNKLKMEEFLRKYENVNRLRVELSLLQNELGKNAEQLDIESEDLKLDFSNNPKLVYRDDFNSQTESSMKQSDSYDSNSDFESLSQDVENEINYTLECKHLVKENNDKLERILAEKCSKLKVNHSRCQSMDDNQMYKTSADTFSREKINMTWTCELFPEENYTSSYPHTNASLKYKSEELSNSKNGKYLKIGKNGPTLQSSLVRNGTLPVEEFLIEVERLGEKVSKAEQIIQKRRGNGTMAAPQSLKSQLERKKKHIPIIKEFKRKPTHRKNKSKPSWSGHIFTETEKKEELVEIGTEDSMDSVELSRKLLKAIASVYVRFSQSQNLNRTGRCVLQASPGASRESFASSKASVHEVKKRHSGYSSDFRKWSDRANRLPEHANNFSSKNFPQSSSPTNSISKFNFEPKTPASLARDEPQASLFSKAALFFSRKKRDSNEKGSVRRNTHLAWDNEHDNGRLCPVPKDYYCVLKDHPCPDDGAYATLLPVERVPVADVREGADVLSFCRFRTLASRLKHVNPANLKENEKLPFWINIHNAFVMKIFLEKGPLETRFKLISALKKAKINIGGSYLNPMEIEHKILRVNSNTFKAKNQFFNIVDIVLENFQWIKSTKNKPLYNVNLRRKDRWLDWGLKEYDPFINFALCSGTYSSPALRVYSASDIKNELHMAKEEYMLAAIGISPNGKLILPKMFQWYWRDFVPHESMLLDWVLKHLPPSQRLAALDALPKKRGQPKSALNQQLKFCPYDTSFRYLLSKNVVGDTEQGSFHDNRRNNWTC